MGRTDGFQIFAKPVGASCNLRCSYCYYLEKKNLYGNGTLLMDDKILERFIRQNIEASADETVMFSWHGGEALLAGIDFFRTAVTLQKRLKPSGRKIINGIQTNGTLLNDEWCRFLYKEKFIVGISIDGPEKIHDINRVTRDGKPSFLKAMNGFRLLRQHGILPEILCVVNSENVKFPVDIYRFLRDLGIKYITFLPLVEKHPDLSGQVTDMSVPAVEFGRFLISIFDEWIENDIGRIKIQIIEEALRTAFDQDHTLCIFKENCGGVPALEHNGDLYSCDHYVNSEHLIGNISDTPITELLDSKKQVEFGKNKSQSLPGYCLSCEVKPMCNGECPKNRFITSPDGESGLNYLCEGYRIFFNHCKPFIEAVTSVSP